MIKNEKHLVLSSVLSILILTSAFIIYFEAISKPKLRIDVTIDLMGQFHPSGYIQDFKLSTSDAFIETNYKITKKMDYNQLNNNFSYLVKFTLNSTSQKTSWNYTFDEEIDSRGTYQLELTTCKKVRGNQTLIIEIVAYDGEQEVNNHSVFTNVLVY